MSKISELTLKIDIPCNSLGLDVIGYHEPEMQQYSIYLRYWCMTLCGTVSYYYIAFFQHCVGSDEQLCVQDCVGARPARSSALQTQTTRSWRHEAGSSCRGGELVGTRKCQFHLVQGEFTAPTGQKKVSLSQSSFILFFCLKWWWMIFCQNNMSLCPQEDVVLDPD